MFKRILQTATVLLLLGNSVLLVLLLGERHGWFPRSEAARQSERFRQVLSVIGARYYDAEASTADKLTGEALQAMVRDLDPHSEYLDRRSYTKVQDDLRSEFGGIGVQIELRDEKVVVIAPIAGTPGERAGILRGDRIVGVDGRPLEAPVLRNAVDRLRGKPGTTVKVGLERGAEGDTRNVEVAIVREIIKVETIRGVSMLAPGIGYIQLTQFTERTGEEFDAALRSLESQGLEALVLDLRNNPGGLLSAAVAVLDPFFRPGELVVYTEGREPGSRSELHASGDGGRRQYPIAVLVNAGSASAAEIVTGALRDTRRAVVVGERTFGKGSVQTLLPLPGGDALRLTTARYFTPGGQVIHGKGIAPDVDLPVSAEDDRKLGIQRLRADLGDPAEFRKRFEFDPIPDRQLEAAVDVLRGLLAFPGATVAEKGNAPLIP